MANNNNISSAMLLSFVMTNAAANPNNVHWQRMMQAYVDADIVERRAVDEKRKLKLILPIIKDFIRPQQTERWDEDVGVHGTSHVEREDLFEDELYNKMKTCNMRAKQTSPKRTSPKRMSPSEVVHVRYANYPEQLPTSCVSGPAGMNQGAHVMNIPIQVAACKEKSNVSAHDVIKMQEPIDAKVNTSVHVTEVQALNPEKMATVTPNVQVINPAVLPQGVASSCCSPEAHIMAVSCSSPKAHVIENNKKT